AARELQEARDHHRAARAAEEPDGQGPAPRPAGPARPVVSPGRGPSRARRPPSRPPRADRGPAVALAGRGGVAWMTLAPPPSRNGLDAELMGALVEACAAVEESATVRVAVLAAEGSTFSAGLPPGCRWPPRAWPDGVAAVAALTKPVIAAVQGEALGWG